MNPIIQRLIYGLVVIFLASQTLTIGLLFTSGDSILMPKTEALLGLLALFAISVFVFKKDDNNIIGISVSAGFLLLIISLFFDGPYPMHQYAAVRHINQNGFISSDEVYLRSAPVVKMLESEGARTSKDGGSFGIERYLYSPRIGILLGKSLGDGDGSPDLGYETSGVSAWLFGVRVACEQFTFYAINLCPLIVAWGAYRQWKKKPLRDSLTIDPMKALFLTGPFAIGLIPLIGT
jgi:hypothetical protein